MDDGPVALVRTASRNRLNPLHIPGAPLANWLERASKPRPECFQFVLDVRGEGTKVHAQDKAISGHLLQLLTQHLLTHTHRSPKFTDAQKLTLHQVKEDQQLPLSTD